MSNFRVTTSRRGGRSFDGSHRNEHDDRVNNNQGSNNRYRSNRNNRGRGASNNGPNPRSFLDDEDIDMDRQQQRPRNRSRFNPYGASTYQHPNSRARGGDRGYDQQRSDNSSRYGGSGGRTRVPRGGGSARRSQGNYTHARKTFTHDGWYKVLIPNGAKAGKDFILTQLASMCEDPFVPVNFHLDHNNAVFNVEGKHAASSLQNCSRRISMPNGYKLVVTVSSSGPPHQKLTSEAREKIKLCMSKRYDAATKSLNLNSFGADEDFKSSGMNIFMSRRDVLDCILRTVKENIPELESLDLSCNKLMNLEGLRSLETSAKALTHLNLGNNNIKVEFELDNIKLPSLLELCLDGNPMCDRFRDETAYISAIRKRYPKVLRLDGTQLPPPITFDVEEGGAQLPAPQGSFFLNQPVKDLVCRFLEQYFALYDSASRQDLINAYHDQAFFSLYTCNYRPMNTKSYNFNAYFKFNRNLKRSASNPSQKSKTLKIGRLPIVSLLTELPSTKHDPAAFVVDVTHASENLMSFTVHGLFKETDGGHSPIFSFARMFVTAPQGQGIVIVNEQLTIGMATHEQAKTAFKTPAPTPSPSPVQDNSGAMAVPPVASGSADNPQQAMLLQFCQHSGMKVDWATKCLEENHWNFEVAAKVFTELNGKGSIPPEAFK